MKWFGKCVDYFFTGMGFGAICYVCILTFFNSGVAPTVKETVSVLGLSGLIGFVSLIFKSDLPITISFIIHLVVTFVLFLLMGAINNWEISLRSILLFILTYIIIWLICLLEQKKTVNRINDRIRKRKSNKFQ